MAQACAVGVITGCGAILYDALIQLVQGVALSSDDHPLHVLPELPWYRILLVPTLGGLAVGLVAFFRSRDAQGHGVPEVIESVALGNGKFHWQTALSKSVSSALTIGSGGSVGREGPIVHIGASLGSVLGQLLKVPPNRLPTLAGCGVAGGIDVRRREQTLMQGFSVGQVMRPEPPTFRAGAPFPEVMDHFLASTLPLNFVVDGQQRLLGIISIHDVKATLQDDSLAPLVVAVDLARPPDTVTTAQETLARCLEKFSLSEQEYLPVLSVDQKLEGIVSRYDVLDLYNREILRNEYLGVSLRSEALTEMAHQQVHLPHEYIVEIVHTPPPLIGRTLGESQLRRRFNVTAIAVRRGGFHSPDALPDPDTPLRQEDSLVLVGRAEHLRRLTDMTEETTPAQGA